MIRTEDCKVAIISHLSKRLNLRSPVDPDLLKEVNWKRINKKGNAKTGIVRIFQNKITGLVLNVHATETEITEIKRGTLIVRSDEQQTGILKLCIKRWMDDGMDAIPSSLPWESLPQIAYREDDSSEIICDQDKIEKCDIEGYDENWIIEDIDFENFEILELDDKHIRLAAGGDWQSPIVFDGIIIDGKLVFDKNTVSNVEHYKKGLSSEEILHILGN